MSTWKFLSIVLLVVTIFSAIYFPSTYTWIHFAAIAISGALFAVLVRSVMRELKRRRDENIFKETIKAGYAKFVTQRGELFERTVLPMSESDKREIENKIRILVALTLSIVLLIAVVLFFVWNGDAESYLFLVLIVAILFFSGWTYTQYRSVFNSNQKTVVKGVVTDKRKISDDDSDFDKYEFEISNKEWISVSSLDYGKFTYGDVIEIHTLSDLNSLSFKKMINLVGKLPTVDP